MGLLFDWADDLFVSVGTKAKEAAAKVAEPYLPEEPYVYQEPLNLDSGMWTDPLPMPEPFYPDEIATEWDAAQGGFADLFTPPMEPIYDAAYPADDTFDPNVFGGFEGLYDGVFSDQYEDPTRFRDRLTDWRTMNRPGTNPWEDVLFADPIQPEQQGYVTPMSAPALYDFGPQEATPIDWGQWDSMPVPGEETVFAGTPSPEYNPELVRWQSDQADQFSQLPPEYSLNLDWSLPVTDYDTMTGEPIRQTDWTVGNRELGSASGGQPFDELWNGYNRVQNAFAETGLDLTPAFIDSLSGQGVNDLLGGGFLGNMAERGVRQMVPGAGLVGLGSDVAETLGWYKPGTGYDDAAGTGQNLFESKGNLWDFAGQQSEDLGERPLAEQIAGQVIFDPTNIVGGGWLSKMDDVPDWLRAADYGIDAVQSAPFKAIGGARFLDEISGPIGRQLGGETGEASAKLAARLGVTAGGAAAGYASGDTEEEKRDRALMFGLLTGGIANADTLGKAYGAGLRFLPGDVGTKARFGVDKLASREHMWADQIFPIPEINKDESFGVGLKALNKASPVIRRVQDVPVVHDAAEALNLLHGKALAVSNELTGSLMQTLDDAAIRIDPDTGRALTRDGRFMPVFKTGQKGIDPGDLDAEVLDNVATEKVIDEAADWADVAEQWWKYLDAGYIDQSQVAALRKVDSELGRIRAQQELMGIKQPDDRPLWNYVAPEGESSLYFPRGVPESQNVPTDALKGETADSIRVFGRTPGTSKEAKFETAGENIVENNRRYPALDERLSRYIVGELDEIARFGVLPQIMDVPLGISIKNAKGEDVPATLGDLLFDGKDQLEKVRAKIKPLDRTIRTAIDKARVYSMSSRVSQRNVDRLDKVIAEVEQEFGDVTPRSAKAAATFIRADADQALDDALAVLDSADEMWKTAAREGDSIRAAQIQAAPELAEEAKRIRLKIAETKKALAANAEEMGVVKAYDDLGIPGPVPYDMVVLQATRDALQDSIIFRDTLLKANPLAAPEGVALDQKKAEALQKIGKRLTKASKKEYANAAEEIGSIYRALGQVEVVQKEIKAQEKWQDILLTRADKWVQDVVAAAEKVAPLKSERRNLLDMEKAAAAARAAVKDAGPTGRVNIGGIMNVELPQDIATTINRAMKSYFKEDKGIPIVNAINKLTRPFMTALDASFVGATGTGTMFDQPQTFARGAKQGIEAMIPKVGRTAEAIERDNVTRWNKILEANDLPSLETLIGRYNLQVGTSELSLGQATKDSFTTALKDRRVIDAYGNLPGIKQSGQGFTVAGNTFRAETAVNNLVDLKIRNGGKLDDDAINSIVTAANSIGGRANRSLGTGLGGVPVLGNKKAGDLWFAGRFYQSQFDLLANAVLNGNLEGDLARASLIRLGTAGFLTTKLLNDALGQPTEWNPITEDGRINPNWMRVRMLGYDISPFGAYDALAKTVMATVVDPTKGGEAVTDYFRQRLSPGMGVAADRIIGFDPKRTGVEFDGAIPKVTNPGQLASQLNPLPLSAQSIAGEVLDTDWGDPESVARTLFGVSLSALSLKANPMTDTERMMDEFSKQYSDFSYGGTDLNSRAKKLAKEAAGGDIDNDPLALAIMKSENPDLVPEPRSDSSKAYAAAKADRDAAFAKADKDFRAGKITLNEFNKAVKSAKDEYRGETKNIEFPDSGNSKQGETPRDWVDAYFDIFDIATDAETEEVDWDKFDREYQKMLSKFGGSRSERDAIDAYIDEYLMKDLPKALREQKKAYNALDDAGYFDMKKYNLKVLDDDQAREYQAEVIEQVNLEWEEKKKKYPKATKPEFATVSAEYLKDEYGLSTSEIQDVNRVNSGKKYWTPEYKSFREENADLIVWFDQKATWAVIQARQD